MVVVVVVVVVVVYMYGVHFENKFRRFV